MAQSPVQSDSQLSRAPEVATGGCISATVTMALGQEVEGGNFSTV